MVHDVKVEAQQIRNVAGLVKGQYLPATLTDNLRPVHEAIDDEAAYGGPVPGADDCFAAPHLPDGSWKPQDSFFLFGRNVGGQAQPLE
jgi:hypothetical protein